MNLNEKLDELDKQFLEEYKFNDSEAKYLKQNITSPSLPSYWSFPKYLFRCYFF